MRSKMLPVPFNLQLHVESFNSLSEGVPPASVPLYFSHHAHACRNCLAYGSHRTNFAGSARAFVTTSKMSSLGRVVDGPLQHS